MPEELDTSPRCVHCGYPLAHLTQSRCPECGNPFDLQNPETYHRPTITSERNWTIQELATLLSISALLALRPHDTGELVYELVLEAALLYALALFFAVTNDKFWLTPGLFFLGLNGICWSVCWRESRMYTFPFFECRLIVLAGIFGLLGSLALAGTKAEVRAARRRGQASRFMNFCERVARSFETAERP